jgi:penicillin-insensitive murein endopeptidase
MSLPKGTTGRSGYNPLQPRVPKGKGDDSGEWTAAANSNSGTAARAPETHQQRVARFKQLRQDAPNAGYYNWGTPTHGVAQHALSETIEGIEEVAKQWHEAGKPPFGVGNISLKTGEPYDKHKGHGDGIGVDIRPVRKDGKQVGDTTFNDPAYDREATQRLVYMFLKTGRVEKIFFNDPKISGVVPLEGHDNHLHVKMKLP